MPAPAKGRASVINKPKGNIRPVVQITGELIGDDKAFLVKKARDITLRWIEEKMDQKLPFAAWQGQAIDFTPFGAPPTSILTHEDGTTSIWMARFDDSDDTVLKRDWIAEIALVSNQSHAFIGIRLTCVSLGPDEPFAFTIPRVAKGIGQTIGIQDANRRFSPTPWVINTNFEAEKLIDFIQNQHRKRQIIVLSLPYNAQGIADTSVDSFQLARNCYGIAHVVVLHSAQCELLKEELGKEFSVFDGGIRTYQPKFDVSADNFVKHPLALLRTIQNYNGGSDSFLKMLTENAFRSSVSFETLFKELPSFSTIRQKTLRLKQENLIQAHLNPIDLVQALEHQLTEANNQNATLVKEQEDFYAILEEEEKRVSLLKENIEELKTEIYDRSARIEFLEDALRKTGKSSALDIPVPDSLDYLEEWAQKYLASKVHLTPKALRAAKKSTFSDISLIYKCLIMLANEYREMRTVGGKENFDNKLLELKVKDEPCFRGDNAGNYENEYLVDYNGRKRYLEDHLKSGVSFDPKHSLRIYYFWDEETQQVVIGHLPSHLTTRKS